MAALPDHTPDLVKYTTFIRNVVRIGTNYLPAGSQYLQHSFDHSLDEVNLDLSIAAAQRTSWSVYELAVYNLGAHLLIKFAEDVSYDLSAMSWAAGLVTGTTTSAHLMLPGDPVKIIAVSPLAYAGPQKVGYVTVTDVTDSTHFGYHIPRNPGTAVLLPGASVQEQFFANIRRYFKINSFVPGIVANTSDLTTSVGLDNPDFMKNLTLEQLQLIKTPYGRRYLEIAQKYGPTIWGVT